MAQEESDESEKCDLADHLSRGLFGEFLERAKENGFSEFRWADIRRLVIQINLVALVNEMKFIFFRVLFQFALSIFPL